MGLVWSRAYGASGPSIHQGPSKGQPRVSMVFVGIGARGGCHLADGVGHDKRNGCIPGSRLPRYTC